MIIKNIQTAKDEAHRCLSSGRIRKALFLYEEICRTDPSDGEAHFQLAVIYRRVGEYNKAINTLIKTITINPAHIDASILLGRAKMGLGNLPEAVKLFDTAHRLKRGLPINEQGLVDPLFEIPDSHTNDESFSSAGKHNLKHDAEQLRYLVSKGLIPSSYKDVANEYDKVASEIDAPDSLKPLVVLNKDQRQRIGNTYHKFLYNVETPEIPSGHAVNPNADLQVVEGRYHEKKLGVTHFDDFLTPQALLLLNKYCLESTIWYRSNYPGYVGAMIDDGFSCGLLQQISEELCKSLPSIFRDHKLMYCWAYKYDSVLEGIRLHADNAAINVNFWITPDEANLEPDTGGLIVYDAEAPLEWEAEKFNGDAVRIRKHLNECNSDSVRIPYRQNRAIIFHSNLFHETDDFHFKEGYENRRINITMLFGIRGT